MTQTPILNSPQANWAQCTVLMIGYTCVCEQCTFLPLFCTPLHCHVSSHLPLNVAPLLRGPWPVRVLLLLLLLAKAASAAREPAAVPAAVPAAAAGLGGGRPAPLEAGRVQGLRRPARTGWSHPQPPFAHTAPGRALPAPLSRSAPQTGAPRLQRTLGRSLPPAAGQQHHTAAAAAETRDGRKGVVCVMVAAVGVSQVQSSRLLELLLLLLGIVMELLRILSCMVRVLCILKRVGRLLLIVHRLGTLLLLRVCKLLRAIKLLRLVVKGRGPKHAARLLLPLLLLAAVLLLLAMMGLLR